MQTIVIVLEFVVLPICAIVAGFFVFRRGGRKRTVAAPGDVVVPLAAAFGSRKGLGPFAGTHNNFNPLLVLHADAVEYRAVKRTTAPYGDIAEVDAAPGRWSSDIILTFGDGYRFTGRTKDRAALAAALKQLAAKGCLLTQAASALDRPTP
jgi:hypothetical protein